MDRMTCVTETRIHSTAIVHSEAQIGNNVEIGPYSIVGRNVVIGDNCQIGSHVVLEGWTSIGSNNRIYHGAILGQEPQDLKFSGEESFLKIGDSNLIREFVTISSGTASGGGITSIGHSNLIMSYVHIGHDVNIHDHVMIANSSQIAGHVTIEKYAVIGGMTGIHQFSRIGEMSMVGGRSAVIQDVPPYFLVSGNPVRAFGLNAIGLKRHNMKVEIQLDLKRAFKFLYRKGLTIRDALEQIETQITGSSEICHLLDFIRRSKRGICKGGEKCIR